MLAVEGTGRRRHARAARFTPQAAYACVHLASYAAALRWWAVAALVLFTIAFNPLRARTTSARSSDSPVRLYGVDYIDARGFGQRFGLTPEWRSPGRVLRLKSRWTTIELTQHRVELQLNGTPLYLSEPVVAHRGSLYLSRGDAESFLTPLLAPQRARAIPRPRTIVLDPGHGGSDPGNRNTRLRLDEKVFTLDVARRLERLLKAQGYRVVLTRTGDRAVDLDDRTEIARRAGADLFISIHFNSAVPSVRGVETFVLTPQHQRSSPQRERDGGLARTAFPGNRHDHWSTVLGYDVHRHLVAKLGAADRGLKRFRYRVLATAPCPAVLVEAGFLSHTGEGRQVSSTAYRQRIAEGIAAGIRQHGTLLARLRSQRDRG